MMALFDVGQVVMTNGVADKVAESETYAFLVQKALQMHSEGNWAMFVMKTGRAIRMRSVMVAGCLVCTS